MYMSYCRFEGTRMELSACLNEVRDHIYDEAEYKVSEGEIENFKRIVEMFYEFLEEEELLSEDGNLDRYELDNICESMRHAQEDPEY